MRALFFLRTTSPSPRPPGRGALLARLPGAGAAVLSAALGASIQAGCGSPVSDRVQDAAPEARTISDPARGPAPGDGAPPPDASQGTPGPTADAAGDMDAGVAPPASDGSDEPSEASGPCGAVIEQHPIEGALHVDYCSAVTYLTNPPSSGNHYPIWAAFETYASAIPPGFWVHDLEHGAVVVTYRCPSGCASQVAAAQAWIDALPADPLCDPTAGDPRVRVVMTPDPDLDVPFAASAWGWTLRAQCFDPDAFTAFFAAHYGQGPEAICANGADLSTGVQEGCGE